MMGAQQEERLRELPEVQALGGLAEAAEAMVLTVEALIAEGRSVPAPVAKRALALNEALGRLASLSEAGS